jgi:hypothetical protein
LGKAHVNKIVNTSGKSVLLVKLVAIARCVRVLFLVNRIRGIKIIEGIDRRKTKAAISIIIK